MWCLPTGGFDPRKHTSYEACAKVCASAVVHSRRANTCRNGRLGRGRGCMVHHTCPSVFPPTYWPSVALGSSGVAQRRCEAFIHRQHYLCAGRAQRGGTPGGWRLAPAPARGAPGVCRDQVGQVRTRPLVFPVRAAALLEPACSCGGRGGVMREPAELYSSASSAGVVCIPHIARTLLPSLRLMCCLSAGTASTPSCAWTQRLMSSRGHVIEKSSSG